MVIVVGSGAGGATVAKELAIRDIPVILIEKGPLIKPKDAFTTFDEREKDIDLLKTTCVGGSTMVSAGNGMRVLERELKSMGIDLSAELSEAERELGVNTLPDSHLGEGTKVIMDAAHRLGLPIRKMPKFIRSSDCKPCGKCSFGCPRDAKWTSLNYIKEAQNAGARVLYNTTLNEIIIENGALKGVTVVPNKMSSESINSSKLRSNLVILAAGAIETARILQKTGIDAGNSFFMDTFVTVGGVRRNIRFNEEVSMAAVLEFENFILAPHFSTIIFQKLQRLGIHNQDILGLMVKIKDESSGQVTPEKILKNNTLQDIRFLVEGAAVAGSILSETGVNPSTIVSTHPRGAHPGGTAPIGDVVDLNLETKFEGLFVADASVLPFSPGAPPILTIIALAKRLSKHIFEKYLI